MSKRAIEIFDNLKTPHIEIAKHCLFSYSVLFNKEIEPNFCYDDKFFTILSYSFQKFLKSNHDLFILEASPRTGKTDFLINIVLVSLIGNLKNNNFILITATQAMKKELRKKLTRIIKSKLFEDMYPEVETTINNDDNMNFSNGNSITFTTTNSSVPIGTGFHWIFLIDFLNSDIMRSQPQRLEAFAQLKNFLSRTQHNPTTRVVVDNQRLGVDDLSSYFVQQYTEVGLPFTRLTFPYQFQEDCSYDINGIEIKFRRGEYLVSRFNDLEKSKLLARQGHYNYETQYLQKPRRARGDFIKREMLRYYSQMDLDTVQFEKGFITTDLALKDKEVNDFNVYCFWLTDADQNLYLIDMLRLKIKGLKAESALYNFYLKWKDGLRNGGVGCNQIQFEDVSTSELTIQRFESGIEVDTYGEDGNRLRQKVILGGLVKRIPRLKNKFSRFMDSLAHIESGRLFLPSHDVKINGVRDIQYDIIEPLISELENFREDDTHEHDDILDNVVDGINEARAYNSSYKVEF